uniref:AtuA-like ferredoxin-fold domain-containing protein n=2 Tax=Chenopodium quinoa TaxID=63459 RepID=A0A803MPX0_CHEQI
MANTHDHEHKMKRIKMPTSISDESVPLPDGLIDLSDQNLEIISSKYPSFPAPSGKKVPLYEVAHIRVGDKGNDMNFSIIPHFFQDINRLQVIISPEWVKKVLSPLLNPSPFPHPDAISKRDKWVKENVKVEIYEVKGIHSLNVVVRNILDSGVNCSRRIDRHGKTISDTILSQQVMLP